MPRHYGIIGEPTISVARLTVVPFRQYFSPTTFVVYLDVFTCYSLQSSH